MFRQESAEVATDLPLEIESPPKTRRRIRLVAILGLILIVALLVGIKAAQIGAMIKAGKSFVPPPESVATAKVETATWQAARAAVGSVVAVRGVILSAEVTGTVREIDFDSGTSVKRGAVLVRLDSSTEQAQLESARADAALAKVTVERHRKLRETGNNSPADLDAAEARAKQTNANVAVLEATIAKKTIRAPFDGRIAIRQVELGQILSPGTPVASLQSVNPIYVEFSLPQQALAELKLGQKVRMTTDIFAGSSWEGEVTVINPEVDVTTRNVRIRATIANPDGRLTPGMFANVDVLSNEKRQVLIIPATAVIYAPYGDSVFAVEEKDAAGKTSMIAHQKFIRLGERRGDFVALVSGLSAGETIVSAGAFKLRNGMAVAVNNSLAPPAELAPKPADK
jgi:membrane fusion protein (multidrug efflux system)